MKPSAEIGPYHEMNRIIPIFRIFDPEKEQNLEERGKFSA